MGRLLRDGEHERPEEQRREEPAQRALPTGPEAILALQRSAGNHATAALLREPYNKWEQKRSTRKGGNRKAKWLREYEAKVDGVRSFMEQRVAPWATQARIAELINTNFNEMKSDDELVGEPKSLRPSEHRDPQSEDPQIAPGDDVSFLAPNRTGKTAIHRGIVPIEQVEGVAHVRVYSALWAEARPNNEGKIVHKDVHQDQETGQIKVHTGRDQGEKKEGELGEDKNPIMWISAEPLRQLKWFYKYPIEKYNPGAKPVVRSFLVPLELWNQISAEAVSEDEASKGDNKTKPFNVDTAYGSNQFGVRGPLLSQLSGMAAKNSLVSYVGNKGHSKKEYGGDVRNIKELHQQLGAPLSAPPVPVWVDPELGKFTRTKKQQGMANDLSFYYAIWKGNDNLLPTGAAKIPKSRRHEMFHEFLSQNGLALPEDYRLN